MDLKNPCSASTGATNACAYQARAPIASFYDINRQDGRSGSPSHRSPPLLSYRWHCFLAGPNSEAVAALLMA
jgi:hypothetical protein